MIVRINQFDIAQAEQFAGWDARSLRGPIEFAWPGDTNALELLILEQDEKNQPQSISFRQGQVRRLIPEVIAALKESAERVVLRLDGPMVPGELLPVFLDLVDRQGMGRYAVSEVQKFEEAQQEIIGSVRLSCLPAHLSEVCLNGKIALERGVRLRAFCLEEELVNPLLDCTATDDERWGEILPRCGIVLGTARGLKALQVFTRRYTADQARQRLMQRLLGQASAAAAR